MNLNVRQIAVLAIALAAGAAAFFLAMGAKPDSPVQIVQQSEQKTVRILVSDVDLQRGQRLSVENVRWVDWPEKALSPLYLTEGAITPEDLAGAVARTLIVAGEPVIESKIVRAGSGGMMAAILEPGMRAVTMRVTAESASGGFILPGDRVDVYYTEPDKKGDGTTFRLLFEDAKVLAIDANFVESPEASHLAGATATLELAPEDAEYFTTARNSRGQMTLALRSVFEPEEEKIAKPRSDIKVTRYGRS